MPQIKAHPERRPSVRPIRLIPNAAIRRLPRQPVRLPDVDMPRRVENHPSPNELTET